MPQCDVVVIGAGISGLASAALLSRAGLGVSVVEEQPRAGGCLQGFSRQGFTFDTAVQWLNGMGPKGLPGRMFSFLGEGWPKCKQLSRIRRFKSDRFDYLLTTAPDELRDTLAHDFSPQADGIHRLFDDSRRLGEFLRGLAGRMRCVETMSPWTKTLYGLDMLRRFLPVRRSMRSGLESGLARYVSGPEIGRIFPADEKLVSVMAPIAWGYESDFYAPPQGGSQALVRWLIDGIRARGSQVSLGDPVEAVLLEGGRAAGIRCASGRTISSRFVLAACDVQRLYERMLPAGAVPAKLLGKLDRADLYHSSFSLFLGLSCDPRSLGLGEELALLTRADVTREEQTHGDPHKAALTVVAPSVRDPSLAPAGKGTVTVHCPAWLKDQDQWKTGPGLERGVAYDAAKKEFADIILERVERGIATGLRGKIEVMESATPVTYWRYTANRAGSIMGRSPTDRNIRARIAHYMTPVQGLLLGGHWAEYGGGIPMAIKAAANTSLLILRQAEPRAFKELCAVMDA